MYFDPAFFDPGFFDTGSGEEEAVDRPFFDISFFDPDFFDAGLTLRPFITFEVRAEKAEFTVSAETTVFKVAGYLSQTSHPPRSRARFCRGKADNMTSFTTPPKDPSAVLDYSVDWSDWLADGVTITDAEVDTQDASLSVVSDNLNGAQVDLRLSGGQPGTDPVVTLQITTNNGQIDQRSLRVPIRER